MNQKSTLEQAPKLQLRAIYFAGPAVSLMICGIIYAIVWGKDWNPELQQRQIEALAYSLFGLVGILAIIVVALSQGLIHSLSISAGVFKAGINLDTGDSPPQQSSSTPVGPDTQDATAG